MSTENAPTPPVKPVKRRSHIERLIVWGLIAGLLVLVGVEYSAKATHDTAYTGLLERIRSVERGGEGIFAAEVKSFVGNKSPRIEDVSGQMLVSNAKRLEVYSWFTIHPARKRELFVYYGHGADPEVVFVGDSLDEDTYPKLLAVEAERREERAKKAAAAREGRRRGTEGSGSSGKAANGG
jgi:hypothetical protein